MDNLDASNIWKVSMWILRLDLRVGIYIYISRTKTLPRFNVHLRTYVCFNSTYSAPTQGLSVLHKPNLPSRFAQL